MCVCDPLLPIVVLMTIYPKNDPRGPLVVCSFR